MMKVANATVLIVALMSNVCHADDASKSLKLKQYMKVQGLYEVLDQQLKACETQARATGAQMSIELKKQMPEMSQGMLEELDGAFQRFVASAKPNWTPEEAVELFAKNYGEKISERDLDKILAFWASPVGQKDAAANAQAVAQWMTFFAERNQPVLERSMSAYITEVREITARNNRRKEK